MSSSPLAAPVASAGATPVPPGLAVVVLALLLSIQPVTTDLYLPALPALTRALGAPVAAGQLTLSALLLAFGCSQLVWGPLADRFGRRPVLLAGLFIYVLASLGSALAPSMALLIAWRTAQGAAMGAVVMCARAIVRDLYTPLAGARAMSKALTGLGLVACLCAPLGGLLTEWLGWRAALMALTAYALGTLALVALRMPETLVQRNPRALQPGTLLRTWALVLRHPTFWAFSLLTTAAYGGLFTFLAASSFVFIEVLGLTRTQYGWVLLSTALAYFVGTFVCRYLLVRHGLRRTVALAGVLSLSGGSLMALVAAMGWHQPWALLLPFYLFMLGHGIHQPCGQTGAVGPFPQAAGVASALNGFMMMLAAFAIGGWVGTHLNGTVWPLVHGVLFWSVLLAAIAWTLVQKFGEPREHA
ncbi:MULTISPECIES: multidrug effflux MFS transporter [unclassified Simplicispira]|uniref:multidrug effflux MFS transporter n=1 Tax=unclassified Simplicispira TaxID=2630407 RepID=UPI000D5CA7B1|nr:MULTISPECIES: multidrug effflux MFS transporter [unclassified Simplicispira]PVY56163.1 DHA1 family bicyclomycin/chloramphenicol resistance-like MFS transporter [Simplicispira sp. 125]REG17108.1 DHA1 family bicyclomycin/chloramphenicol resistance-like MFS transporter [Simplicispira sp. 110]